MRSLQRRAAKEMARKTDFYLNEQINLEMNGKEGLPNRRTYEWRTKKYELGERTH